MEDETEGEHITNGFVFSVHVFDVDDFGGDIARCPATDKEVGFGIGELGKSKVCNYAFPAVLASEYQVLRFKVTVHYFLRVHLFESRKD